MTDLPAASGPSCPPGRIDQALTRGTFSLDGETFDVDNNVWVVGDERECIVFDAPHSVPEILAVDVADGHAPYLAWVAASVR